MTMTPSKPSPLFARVCGPLLLAAVLSLGACSSSGGAGGSPRPSGGPAAEPTSGGTGLWDQLAAGKGGGIERAQRLEAREQAAAALPRGWRERIDSYWEAFTRQPSDVDRSLDPRGRRQVDPERLRRARMVIERDWVQARSEWLELGPAAADILVENMVRWYVFAHEGNSAREKARAQEELLRQRERALPLLISGIGQGAGDDVVRRLLGELVASFGPEAIPAIADELARDRGAADKGRSSLARTLAEMLLPEAEGALARLARDEDEYWQVRTYALDGLGKLGMKESAPSVASALRSDDSSVAKFAARTAGHVGVASPDILEGLIGVLQAGRSAGGDLDAARAALASLRFLSRNRSLGPDPRAWTAYLQREGLI